MSSDDSSHLFFLTHIHTHTQTHTRKSLPHLHITVFSPYRNVTRRTYGLFIYTLFAVLYIIFVLHVLCQSFVLFWGLLVCFYWLGKLIFVRGFTCMFTFIFTSSCGRVIIWLLNIHTWWSSLFFPDGRYLLTNCMRRRADTAIKGRKALAKSGWEHHKDTKAQTHRLWCQAWTCFAL